MEMIYLIIFYLIPAIIVWTMLRIEFKKDIAYNSDMSDIRGLPGLLWIFIFIFIPVLNIAVSLVFLLEYLKEKIMNKGLLVKIIHVIFVIRKDKKGD